MKTVTATSTPASTRVLDSQVSPESQGNSQKNDSTRRVSGSSKYPASVTSAVLRQDTGGGRSHSVLSHNRRSGVFYDDDVDREQGGSRLAHPASNVRLNDAYKESIKRTEVRLRNVGWEALKETLEILADEVRSG
jgi:WD repeat-containing protein 24